MGRLCSVMLAFGMMPSLVVCPVAAAQHLDLPPLTPTWDAWRDAPDGDGVHPPPPPDQPEPPDEPPDLDGNQTESIAVGLEFAMSPEGPHPARVAIDVAFMLFADAEHSEASRKVHLGGIFHLHAGVGVQRMQELDGGERWVVPFIAGGDASVAFMGNRGLFFRTGLDFRFDTRRLPTRFVISPQMAFGHSGTHASFELGVAFEPYVHRRAEDAMGATWDVTRRAWMTFFRIHFAPDD